MMREVHLHGALKARFGGPFLLDVAHPAEAIRALAVQIKDFKQTIHDGSWHILRGDLECASPCNVETLCLQFGSLRELHILPEIEGGKKGGAGKAILGVLIIAVAVIAAPVTGGGSLALGSTAFTVLGSTVTFGQIALFGLSLALTGVSQLLAPSPSKPDAGANEAPDRRPSFLINGEINTTEQGHPVPLGFGRFRVGSQVISSGLDVERI